MANKQSEAYDRYLEQFKDNPKFEMFYEVNLASAKDLGLINKVEGSGQKDGVFLLTDGRVAERMLEFGWMTRFFVFKNKEEWERYNPPMPRSVYFEY